MSCEIRRYCSMDSSNYMDVTAFIGKGNSVQFTINGRYCALSQDAVIDLIDTLVKRLSCIEGYTATGRERDDIEYNPMMEGK